jgi:UDP-N-acetyl-D-mannosaminuronic acid dehydrogenase
LPQQRFDADVVLVGGCGHIGLALGIALADRGASVVLYDVSEPAIKLVDDAVMPFEEPGAGPILERVVADGRGPAPTRPWSRWRSTSWSCLAPRSTST